MVPSGLWMIADRNLYKPPTIRSNKLFIHYYQAIDSPKTPASSIEQFSHFNNSKTTSTITMYFINVIFTLLAASAVMAAPAQDATAKPQVHFPNGWIQCGVCIDIPI